MLSYTVHRYFAAAWVLYTSAYICYIYYIQGHWYSVCMCLLCVCVCAYETYDVLRRREEERARARSRLIEVLHRELAREREERAARDLRRTVELLRIAVAPTPQWPSRLPHRDRRIFFE